MSAIRYGEGFSEPRRLTHAEACRLSRMWNEHPDRGRETDMDFRINEFLKGLIAERLEAEGGPPADEQP